jgi:hypothetical protein
MCWLLRAEHDDLRRADACQRFRGAPTCPLHTRARFCAWGVRTSAPQTRRYLPGAACGKACGSFESSHPGRVFRAQKSVCDRENCDSRSGPTNLPDAWWSARRRRVKL